MSPARQSQPCREPCSIHAHPPFLRAAVLQCTLKYATVHSWCYLSLPFSIFIFFKQLQPVYKSERFLHGVSLDRKMGIQKGQGTSLLMILLLALFRNTERLKIPCSYQIRTGGIPDRNTESSDRPKLILQSLFTSILHSAPLSL